MKRFRFRLERLLAVRSLEEQALRETFSRAEEAARAAEHRAELADSQLAQGLAELRAAQARAELAPAEILRAQDALRRLAQLAQRERAAATRGRARAEKERVPWLARRAEADGLERWRERARASHRREGERAEQAGLDETALQRALRVDPRARTIQLRPGTADPDATRPSSPR